MKALRRPTPHPGRFWFATGFRAVLRGSCSPKSSRADGGAARAWAVWSAGGPVPAGVRVDGVVSHRFPGDPSRAFALLQDPGRISGPSPKRFHRCCPRAQHDEGFSVHMISRLRQGWVPAVYASRATLPRPMQDSLPAGGTPWPDETVLTQVSHRAAVDSFRFPFSPSFAWRTTCHAK